MTNTRAEKFEQLINLLHEADALQQELLGDVDQFVSYEFHEQLINLLHEFESWAQPDENQ